MQNILEIRDLGRSYVNFRLEHISLSIPGGTIMGLVGENGAGKSTTIRAALGLIRKDARRGAVLRRTADHGQCRHERTDRRGVRQHLLLSGTDGGKGREDLSENLSELG